MRASVTKTMIKTKTRILTALSLMAVAGVLPGCVTSSYDEAQTPGLSDPFEEVNRAIFDFNKIVDHALINPALKGYRTVVPAPARQGVDNALNNLQSPIYLANQLLQGDVKGAANVLFSAVVNTFVGFGGLMDVAGYEGYEYESEDFGQTLAVWGIDHGPYVVVPLFGPTSVRDGSGYIIDSFADPLRWYSYNINEKHIYYNKAAASYVNARNNLKDALTELEASSIDYYASVRSSYYQSRKAMVNDQGDEPLESHETIDFPEYDDF